jgi:hypothetical protein
VEGVKLIPFEGREPAIVKDSRERARRDFILAVCDVLIME